MRPRAATALVALLLLAPACESRAAARAAEAKAPIDIVAYVVDGMTRVGRGEPPRVAAATTASIALGRGEYEPFQVVIHAPPGGLTGVDVVGTDLVGPGGVTIAKENLTLYLERYVPVLQSTTSFRRGYRALPPGWYADGLVPFLRADGSPNRTRVPFAVAPDENQPIWIDVFVPRGRENAPPGRYRGTLTVTADQGRATVPLEVDVWDFELPARPTLKSTFSINPKRMKDRRQQRLLIDHKLMQPWLSPGDALAHHDRLNAIALPFFSNAGSIVDQTVGARGMDPPPPLAEIRRRKDAYPPDLPVYQYVADEPNRYWAIYPTIRAWARVFHEAGVKTLVTVPPQPQLLHENEDGTGRSAVDIWVMLPHQFDASDPSYRQAIANGNEIWSYNTLMQDDYAPKWQIDFLPVGFRLQPGFISQSLGLTGVLYWTVDRWTNDDYWADPYYREGRNRFAGDGTLIYPPRTKSFDTGIGTETSGVPSMRLKWLREGVEDFEYVALLKKAGREEFALDVARSVGADWRRWSRDPAAVLEARRKLGAELHRISGGSATAAQQPAH